jgi:hypothetical protein
MPCLAPLFRSDPGTDGAMYLPELRLFFVMSASQMIRRTPNGYQGSEIVATLSGVRSVPLQTPLSARGRHRQQRHAAAADAISGRADRQSH